MAQTELIAQHLKSGGSLTAVSALRLFRCFRLAARINDLRMQGMKIKTDCIIRGGKRYARYRPEVA